LSSVVATLAMVETPSSSVVVSASPETPGDDEAKERLLETGPAITVMAQKPLTSTIRETLRHLRAHAGRWSPWRGLLSYFLYNTAFAVIGNILMAVLPRVIFPVSYLIAYAATGALLAPLHAAWAHKVISMPSKLRVWQRVLGVSDWKHIALPGAFASIADYLALYVTLGVAMLVSVDQDSEVSAVSAIFRLLSIFGVFFFCMLFIILPAHVTLVRIEASLLPDDQDTIVPFDRTFAGKVTSKLLGGTGAIGFLDAWKSFNWEARRRVLKVFLKAIAIETIIVVAFVHVLVLEVYLFLSAAYIRYLVEQAAKNGQN
jgi:hypothetical protein